jgi:hypothetical protein
MRIRLTSKSQNLCAEVLVLEGSFRLSRFASNAPDATTRALDAHTEELRLTRLAREKEDDPIERTLKTALDPTRRFGGETLTTAETLSVADRPVLQIICGTGAEYENTKAVSLYRLQRTFSIALQNSSRNMFVSNCKLYLDIINPKTGSPARHLIQDSFTLNPTESRLVAIVHYAEPTGSTRGDTEKDRIVLHLPLPTGWASRDMWPWWLPLGAYVITLTALSRESEPCEAVFKIWVDESYRLHFGTA